MRFHQPVDDASGDFTYAADEFPAPPENAPAASWVSSYRETFRRHRVLRLPIILAAIISAWLALTGPKSYQSTASLWVDSAASTDSSLGNPNPTIISPAQAEQSVVAELLATRDFPLTVGHRSLLAPYLAKHGSGSGPLSLFSGGGGSVDSRILDALSPKQVVSTVAGPQVLQISFKGPSPVVASSTLSALVSELRRDSSRFSEQHSQRALSYYKSQVQAADQAVASARDQASAYLRQHPGVGSSDPTLGALTTQEGAASTQLAQATAALGAASTNLHGGTGNEVQVIDPPSTSSAPTSGKKKELVTVLAGLFAGALVSLLGAIALTPSRATAPEYEDEFEQFLASSSGLEFDDVSAPYEPEEEPLVHSNGAGRSDAVAGEAEVGTNGSAPPDEDDASPGASRRRRKGRTSRKPAAPAAHTDIDEP